MKPRSDERFEEARERVLRRIGEMDDIHHKAIDGLTTVELFNLIQEERKVTALERIAKVA